MIVIVFGLPGSGKSHFAQRLSGLLKSDYINSDRVRKEILTKKKTYSEGEKLSIYDEMISRMLSIAKQNKTVVVDATFYKDDIRNKFIREAEKSYGIVFIEVVADQKIIRERLKTPRDESDADFEVYKKIKAQWEPLRQPHLMLQSTNDNIDEMLQKALEYLNRIHDKRTNK